MITLIYILYIIPHFYMFYKDCPLTSAYPDVFDLIRNTFVFFIRISSQLYDAFISLNHWNGEEKIFSVCLLFFCSVKWASS